LIQITSPCFIDSSDIWSGDNFPVRFQVKPLATFDPQYGIPVEEYFDKLTIFSHLKNPNVWAGFFQNALNHYPVEDGEKIAKDLLSPERFSRRDQEE